MCLVLEIIPTVFDILPFDSLDNDLLLHSVARLSTCPLRDPFSFLLPRHTLLQRWTLHQGIWKSAPLLKYPNRLSLWLGTCRPWHVIFSVFLTLSLIPTDTAALCTHWRDPAALHTCFQWALCRLCIANWSPAFLQSRNGHRNRSALGALTTRTWCWTDMERVCSPVSLLLYS